MPKSINNKNNSMPLYDRSNTNLGNKANLTSLNKKMPNTENLNPIGSWVTSQSDKKYDSITSAPDVNYGYSAYLYGKTGSLTRGNNGVNKSLSSRSYQRNDDTHSALYYNVTSSSGQPKSRAASEYYSDPASDHDYESVEEVQSYNGAYDSATSSSGQSEFRTDSEYYSYGQSEFRTDSEYYSDPASDHDYESVEEVQSYNSATPSSGQSESRAYPEYYSSPASHHDYESAEEVQSYNSATPSSGQSESRYNDSDPDYAPVEVQSNNRVYYNATSSSGQTESRYDDSDPDYEPVEVQSSNEVYLPPKNQPNKNRSTIASTNLVNTMPKYIAPSPSGAQLRNKDRKAKKIEKGKQIANNFPEFQQLLQQKLLDMLKNDINLGQHEIIKLIVCYQIISTYTNTGKKKYPKKFSAFMQQHPMSEWSKFSSKDILKKLEKLFGTKELEKVAMKGRKDDNVYNMINTLKDQKNYRNRLKIKLNALIFQQKGSKNKVSGLLKKLIIQFTGQTKKLEAEINELTNNIEAQVLFLQRKLKLEKETLASLKIK